MDAQSSYDYAIVRVVPHVEREEFINVGVILFCHARDFLAARIELDEARLLALAPDADVELTRRHLKAIPRICDGCGASGPIGKLSIRERWHWLVAPRSTILQMSPPHTGLAHSPEDTLIRLFDTTVRVRRASR